MIEPPHLHSEERQEYDIMDLELLGKLAIELSVHSHPAVKRSFEKLVESVGTKRFCEDYCALQKFLMKLYHQVQLTSEYSYFHNLQNGTTLYTSQQVPGNYSFMKAGGGIWPAQQASKLRGMGSNGGGVGANEKNLGNASPSPSSVYVGRYVSQQPRYGLVGSADFYSAEFHQAQQAKQQPQTAIDTSDEMTEVEDKDETN